MKCDISLLVRVLGRLVGGLFDVRISVRILPEAIGIYYAIAGERGKAFQTAIIDLSADVFLGVALDERASSGGSPRAVLTIARVACSSLAPSKSKDSASTSCMLLLRRG
jgi:hypothetical protein